METAKRTQLQKNRWSTSTSDSSIDVVNSEDTSARPPSPKRRMTASRMAISKLRQLVSNMSNGQNSGNSTINTDTHTRCNNFTIVTDRTINGLITYVLVRHECNKEAKWFHVSNIHKQKLMEYLVGRNWAWSEVNRDILVYLAVININLIHFATNSGIGIMFNPQIDGIPRFTISSQLPIAPFFQGSSFELGSTAVPIPSVNSIVTVDAGELQRTWANVVHPPTSYTGA